jgi:hypothetical protein
MRVGTILFVPEFFTAPNNHNPIHPKIGLCYTLARLFALLASFRGKGMQDSKFDPHKHHRRSIRLKGYDYSQPGAYFITICTHQRTPLFGDIVDDGMQLNFPGQIARKEWERLPGRFPFLEIGSFVVMPDQLDGILILGRGTAGHDEAIVAENPRRAPTETVVERSASYRYLPVLVGVAGISSGEIFFYPLTDPARMPRTK